MATQVLSQIANYLATVPLQRKQQQYENELANRRLALQEDEAKRKAEADALALENTQFEQQQRNEGQQQLRDYYQAAEIQPAINELKQGKELTKNVAPYSMDYLLAQPEATQLALTDKYKLSQYSKYNKGVEGELANVNKQAEDQKQQKQGTAYNTFGARILYDTPEYRTVVTSEVDRELKNGKITPEQAEFAKGQIASGFAYDYGKAFRETGVEAALKRGVKIQDEYSLAAPKANTAAVVESAKGSAEAHTPQFIATRKSEWDKSLKDYNEAYQQYTLGVKAKDDAAGDVALINALEKVREINSAVMYGDFEKWNKATNLWESMVENGVIEAIKNKTTNRLPPQTKESIQVMLNDLFANRQDMIETAREQNIDNAISNYGWDFKKANQIYRKPTLGTGKGMKPTVPEDLKPNEPTAGTVTTIKSDEEYNKLPSGSVFIGPDGKKRTKP